MVLKSGLGIVTKEVYLGDADPIYCYNSYFECYNLVRKSEFQTICNRAELKEVEILYAQLAELKSMVMKNGIRSIMSEPFGLKVEILKKFPKDSQSIADYLVSRIEIGTRIKDLMEPAMECQTEAEFIKKFIIINFFMEWGYRFFDLVTLNEWVKRDGKVKNHIDNDYFVQKRRFIARENKRREKEFSLYFEWVEEQLESSAEPDIVDQLILESSEEELKKFLLRANINDIRDMMFCSTYEVRQKVMKNLKANIRFLVMEGLYKLAAYKNENLDLGLIGKIGKNRIHEIMDERYCSTSGMDTVNQKMLIL